MAQHRLGEREVSRLIHVHRQGYLLIPGHKDGEYRSLERKECVRITPASSHKTLKSGVTIVDIWRIEPTTVGAATAERLEAE